ncbi:hypothetical protein ACQ3I4_10315 [Zafaria sp. Z1313]|uniref:hypothetical protein n=1 Tax=Zafaria sp. Z1313 TaxID=3423202 RepID=UPI003D303C4A
MNTDAQGLRLDELANAAFGIALGVALLYAFLRYRARTPRGADPRDSARSHAFWTALIALFASGTAGLAEMGYLPAPAYSGGFDEPFTIESVAAPGPGELVLAAASPGLWLGIVYVVAQFTWPRPAGRVRTAALEVRRPADFLPRFLPAMFGTVWLAAVAATAWAWTMPGRSPVPPRRFIERDGSGAITSEGIDSGADGLRAGTEFAPWLLLGLVLLAAAVAVSVLVVTRRSPLGALTAGDDATLRTISLNRLLRTAVLVAGGFFAVAVTYGVAGVQGAFRDRFHAEHGYYPGDYVRGLGDDSLPVDLPLAWVNTFLPVLVLVVVFLMAGWSAPRLSRGPGGGPGEMDSDGGARGSGASGAGTSAQAPDDVDRPGTFAAASRLSRQLHQLGLMAAAFLLLPLGLAAWAGPAPEHAAGISPDLVAALLPFTAYALVLLAGEALVRRGHTPRGGPAQALRTWRFARVPLGFAAAGLLALAAASGLTLAAGGRSGVVLSLLVGATAAAALSAATAAVALRRAPLGRGDAAQDLRLRRLTIHRALRTTAAALLAGAGLLLLLDAAFWAAWFTPGWHITDVRELPDGIRRIAYLTGGVLLASAATAFLWPSREWPAGEPPGLRSDGGRHGSPAAAADSHTDPAAGRP